MLIGVVAAIVGGGGSAKADFIFGEPTNMGPTINTSSGEFPTCFSSDGLEMYFVSARSSGYENWDMWVVRRPTTEDDWGEPMNLGPKVNCPYCDACSSISFDGLELYFASDRPGGLGSHDLWVTTRETKNDEWGTAVNLGPTVNSASDEVDVSISTDGLELYFGSNRSGGYGGYSDIWVTRRATKDDPWGEPVNLGQVVNSSAYEGFPCISADGLALFFSDDFWGTSWRPGGFGGADMWITTRASVNDPWATPVNLGPMVNSSSHDTAPVISPDGSMLYFCSNLPGGLGGYYGDIYQAPIIPIVDLNGDGIMDSADICIMVDHWGENYPLCDIGPTPLGDGIVDVQDLIVLAEHLFEEVEWYDPTLVVYWKLDEIEGTIAEDSVGENDGTLNGEPLWQPAEGKVGGALQFDGIDDYVSTPFILDPAKGPFSAFAWIKGGAPGQVIISQTGGLGGTWLGTNSSEGKLMTGLSDVFYGALESESESVITDGQWHHVGLVYDLASHRHLYVDGVMVNVDSDYVAGMPSDGGLYIGAANDLDAGSFFSGLIDDVRICDVALTPEEIEALVQ
jgi:hypothetical protein